MTDLDERLARVLRDAVPQPPRAIDPGALRAGAPGRARRLRRFAPALAAAVVVAVAACVLLAVHQLGRGSTPVGGGSGSGTFEARALIMPAQELAGARPDPFAGVAFAIPSTEDGIGRLTGAEQQQLADALRHVDCKHPPALSNASDRVVCDATGSFAALVGPSIVTSSDVLSAVPVPPSAQDGLQWTVMITFSAPGASAWRAWTAKYHTGDTSVSPVQHAGVSTCGPDAAVACSDFIAFVVGDAAISIPVTLATLDSVVQISADFDEASARAAAEQIAP